MVIEGSCLTVSSDDIRRLTNILKTVPDASSPEGKTCQYTSEIFYISYYFYYYYYYLQMLLRFSMTFTFPSTYSRHHAIACRLECRTLN